MNIHKHPPLETWQSLCERPMMSFSQIEPGVRAILDAVNKQGDEALKSFSLQFDGFAPDDFLVSEKELAEAEKQVRDELKSAIRLAEKNIRRFHIAQREPVKKITTTNGVTCWRKSVPIEKVGLYIPGGTAPLFSTLLMLGVPAFVAGCNEIIVCTPPRKDGTIAPEILYTASQLGLKKIYSVGGAQAIAAMAYGSESIPAVYKIFGPGNQYVTMAKMLVQQQGVAIDMPAGPSEVLVIADSISYPAFVAADLLSQAEHGADSQVVLVSDDETITEKILSEIQRQLNVLPRKELAAAALKNSKAVLLKNMDDAIAFSNIYAPEHLILATAQPELLAEKVVNAGSVFLGHFSCESAGDYASGTNHTLPTNGYARNYSGVSLDSFMKKITFQELTATGIRNIGPAIEHMAAAEQLEAHKNAVTLRLDYLQSQKNDSEKVKNTTVAARENIIRAKPYSSARDEFSGENKIFLDANENPFDTGYNRYPDPHQAALKKQIAALKHVSSENIFLGNGSDEAIDLLIRAYCEPANDSILICPPTYGMYEVAAAIHDIQVVKIPLNEKFQLDLKNVLDTIEQQDVKIIFLCSPNNPTGNLLNKAEIESLLQKFNGLVVIDEAYIDFSPDGSLLGELKRYEQVVILQTFSKAWGLAGIRLGMAFGHALIISTLDKIKPPYNINQITQQIAFERLKNINKKENYVRLLNEQKKIVIEELGILPVVKKIYPSDANFLLVKFDEPKKIYKSLLENNIVVRDRNSVAEGCLRITIGTEDENEKLLSVLKNISPINS